MRRPAQHHPGHAAAPGWAHPYTGINALGLFYNDGGDPPAPADPPKPGPPPTPTPVPQYTQEDLERIAAKEKDQGKRAGARQALEDFAKEHGFSSVDDAKAFIEAARKAQQDALSEEEKRRQQFEQEQAALAQEKVALAAEKRAMVREQALARLGALDITDDQGQVTTPNLQDALAMLERDLRDQPDADAGTVAEAAAKLKKRRPELFGAQPAPIVNPLPPAPGGAPAGGGPRPQASKDDLRARMEKKAKEMGFRRTDVA